MPVSIDAYDYPLEPDQIAQVPAEPRDAARLLDVRNDGDPIDRVVSDLPDLVKPGDVIVVNNSRVRKARLRLRKQTGGAAEVLLVSPTGDPAIWLALVKPGRRLQPGTVLYDRGQPVVEVMEPTPGGERLVKVLDDASVDQIGALPLPPYIRTDPSDPERYQTVYADRPGSVAAPTAGLHFTPELLERCRGAGANILSVDLEVGLGTFAPVTAPTLDEHRMHSEVYRIDPETWARISAADRVIAVGTTVVRTLETVAQTGEFTGSTDIFIRPGFHWQVVDALLTNFHMPRSTLLVLVEAFIGAGWQQIYPDAINRGYRVGSFGDAMFLTRSANH